MLQKGDAVDDVLRVLVPLDGSPEAEAALPLAAPFFRARPARLTLFRVVARDEPSRAAEAYLARVADALRPHGVVAETGVEWGRADEEILWRARTGHFHMIAMSTHGRGGVRRLFGGSVAEEVLRRAEIPVLMTRPGLPRPQGRRFVVPLDGSLFAERILPDAVRLAKLFDAELHVVDVASPLVAGQALLTPADPTPYLGAVCERLTRQGVKAVPVAREGPAADRILGYADAVGAGMICMTTHGRTALRRVVLGSVAEQVIRESPCPVLVRRVVRADLPVLDPLPAAP